MDAAKPHFDGAWQPCGEERWAALVERHGMKAVVEVALRQQQVMADVEQVVSEIAQSKSRHDIPHAEKPDPWARFDHRVAAGPADPAVHHAMTEVEGGGGTAAESDDVDGRIARRPVLTQLIVGVVDACQLAEPEHSAQRLADDTEPRAHAGQVEVLRAGVLAVGLEESDDVRVLGIRLVTVLGGVPGTVECVQRHVPAPSASFFSVFRRGQATYHARVLRDADHGRTPRNVWRAIRTWRSRDFTFSVSAILHLSTFSESARPTRSCTSSSRKEARRAVPARASDYEDRHHGHALSTGGDADAGRRQLRVVLPARHGRVPAPFRQG